MASCCSLPASLSCNLAFFSASAAAFFWAFSSSPNGIACNVGAICACISSNFIVFILYAASATRLSACCNAPASCVASTPRAPPAAPMPMSGLRYSFDVRPLLVIRPVATPALRKAAFCSSVICKNCLPALFLFCKFSKTSTSLDAWFSACLASVCDIDLMACAAPSACAFVSASA